MRRLDKLQLGHAARAQVPETAAVAIAIAVVPVRDRRLDQTPAVHAARRKDHL
jgi:hypothetical protein